MRTFEYVHASSSGRAIEHLSGDRAGGVHAKGAGIDLLDLAKERIIAPSRLVSLDRAGLARIEIGDSIRIGATATLAQVAGHEGIARLLPALARAAAEAATPQIRNRATVAGNLCQRPRCWYFRNLNFECLKKGGETCFAQDGLNAHHAIFDNHPCAIVHPSNLAPALVALGASVEVEGPKGTRTVALDHFFVRPADDIRTEHVLAPDEILTAIAIPAPGDRTSGYAEFRHRQSFDWPVVAAAVAGRLAGQTIESPRIVLGAVAPTPRRALAAEKIVAGGPMTADRAAKAAAAAFSDATPLAGNGYKIEIGRTLLADLLTKMVS